MIRVAALHIYPAKSMAGFSPPRATVHRHGLQHDRRWMLVDAHGTFLTQRTLPRLALLTPRPTELGLAIAAPGLGEIEAVPTQNTIQVTVWRDQLAAETCAADVDAFLTHAIGQPCRLVHLGDPSRRPLKQAYRQADETVSFADAFPLLLTATASLDDLNTRLPAPIRMNRFRPNLVVTGAPAWAEDTWRIIRIGEIRFRVAKPCDRCIATTVEQETANRPNSAEPLRTLGTFRRTADGVVFGQNLIPLDEGEIATGMAVEILDAGASNVQLINQEKEERFVLF